MEYVKKILHLATRFYKLAQQASQDVSKSTIFNLFFNKFKDRLQLVYDSFKVTEEADLYGPVVEFDFIDRALAQSPRDSYNPPNYTPEVEAALASLGNKINYVVAQHVGNGYYTVRIQLAAGIGITY